MVWAGSMLFLIFDKLEPKKMRFKKCPVLLAGNGKLIWSMVNCLLEAGHQVWFWPKDPKNPLHSSKHDIPDGLLKSGNFQIINKLEALTTVELAVVVTSEDLEQKKDMITDLEKVLQKNSLIGINSESIPLSQIQEASMVPERVIGLNWVEPVDTTFFLEVITNQINRKEDIAALVNIAKEDWGKDPYVLENDLGIRSRLLAALVREAFYLIENGYVTVEDIDRACRNDAGYYLPFAGNCRYMDLMGTAVYGTVMADLNPELSKATHIPLFLSLIHI